MSAPRPATELAQSIGAHNVTLLVFRKETGEVRWAKNLGAKRELLDAIEHRSHLFEIVACWTGRYSSDVFAVNLHDAIAAVR